MKMGREKLQTLNRWTRFSAVGLLGFCVQGSAVYLFHESWKLRPLLATALAVESAVVHNFVWHHALTWSDRPVCKWPEVFQRLLAFNVTNGVVSLAGNLLFVWLIVERAHVSLLTANLVAISVLALANFILSDKLVFRARGNRAKSAMFTKMRRPVRLVVPVLICIAAAAACTRAQDAASPKFTVFAGPGIIRTQGISRGEIQAGVSLDEAPPDSGGGISFEVGYLGPWSKPHIGSVFLSVNYMAAWNFGSSGSGRTGNGTSYWSDRGWRALPFATVGYTRLFGTGNAVNFGGGIDYRFSNTRAIRVEVRDYYSPSRPIQHDVALRIGLIIYISD